MSEKQARERMIKINCGEFLDKTIKVTSDQEAAKMINPEDAKRDEAQMEALAKMQWHCKPGEIVILGKPYKIQYMDDINMQGMIGSAKRTKQAINISTEQAKEMAEETLLHEVVHIIDGELILGLSEETVTRLAVGLYSAGYRFKVEE